MRGKYTQQELLLLSNFVYIPACRSDATIRDIIDPFRDESGSFTEASVLEAARGGGMSCRDVATVFDAIDKRIEENPTFGDLSASRRLEEADVRAVCYTDPKDNSPVVVFRGTGGTAEAWRDNFEGAFEEDTKIQKIADDFLGYECGGYEDIVVTGHSKGGNLAQFVTVKHEKKILECVSYDGQGFGDDFLSENPEEIRAASPKITSISAYNDFVNILLTCIAGTSIFVANDQSAVSAHSSVTLITENTFDEAGNFTSTRHQGPVANALKHFTDIVCDMLGPAQESTKETMAAIAGTSIALALSTPKEELADACLGPVAGMTACALINSLIIDNVPGWDERALFAQSVYVDITSVKSAADCLRWQAASMDNIAARVNDIRQNIAYSITARLCAEQALLNAYEGILAIQRKLEDMSDAAHQAANVYMNTEESAAALMHLQVSQIVSHDP